MINSKLDTDSVSVNTQLCTFQSQLFGTVRTSEGQVELLGLSPCSVYWVIPIAVNCGLRVSGDAYLLGLYRTTPFNLTFCLGQTFMCTDLIGVNAVTKLAEVEEVLTSVIAAECSTDSTPCYASSEFSCSTDNTIVLFK